MIVIKYNTIQATTIDEINRLVNQLLELGEGWEPLGGIARLDPIEGERDLHYVQTMVRRVQRFSFIDGDMSAR